MNKGGHRAADNSDTTDSSMKDDPSLRMSFGRWTLQDKMSWTCAACTVVNEPLHLTCVVCGKRKGHGSHRISSSSSSSSHRISNTGNDNTGNEEEDPFLELLRLERRAEVLELQESILSQAAMEMEMSLCSTHHSSASTLDATVCTAGVCAAGVCAAGVSAGHASATRSRSTATAPTPTPSYLTPMLADPRSTSSAYLSPGGREQRRRSPRNAARECPDLGAGRGACSSYDDQSLFTMSEQQEKQTRNSVALQATPNDSSNGNHSMSSALAASLAVTPTKPSPPSLTKVGLDTSPDNHNLDPDILHKIALRSRDAEEGAASINRNGSTEFVEEQQQKQLQHQVMPGAYQKMPGAQAVRNEPTKKKAPPRATASAASAAAASSEKKRPARRINTSPATTTTTTTPPRRRAVINGSSGEQLDADVLEKIATASRESNAGTSTSTAASAPAPASAPAVAQSPQQTQPGAYHKQPGAEAVRNSSLPRSGKDGSPSLPASSALVATARVTRDVPPSNAAVQRVDDVPAVCASSPVSPIKRRATSGSSGINPTVGTSPNSPCRTRDRARKAAKDLLKNGLNFRKPTK